MINTNSYQAKQFNLSGLNGISDRTLEMHFKLYEGYVKETNKLTEKIAEILRDGKVDQEEMPAYSELTRRLGFEYNGMVLHEYYFDNMKQGGTGRPGTNLWFLQSGGSELRQLRHLEGRLCGHRQDARRRLGHLLPESGEWTTLESLDLRCMRRATWPASIRYW